MEQIVPTDFAGLLFGALAQFGAVGGRHLVNAVDDIHQFVNHIPVVVFGACHNLNAILDSVGLFQHPLAESRKACGHCGHANSDAFKRCVAPRLVVRREGRQIETAQQVVVRHIEDAVVAVQIDRNQHHIHLLSLIVSQLQLMGFVHHGVVVVGVERVRCDALVGYADIAVGQTVLQAFARTVVEVRHQNETDNVVLVTALLVQFAECVDKDVDALVFELVAARDCHKQSLIVALVACQRLSNLCKFLAGFFGHIVVHMRQVVECKSVRCNCIGFVIQKHLALVGRHLAHCCIDRCHLSGGLFE